MAVDVGTAVGYLDIDISGFLEGLKTAQSEAQNASKNMATKMGEGLKGVGESLTSVGSTLTKSVTTPIVGLGTAIVKTSADFESSMSKVQAISGATGSDFDKLNQKAREMGSKTKFSASEAAEAFQYMAMAGWDVDSMLGGISGVMNLAAASGENLGTVSDIVTDAMTAFGLSAKETSKVLKDGIEVEVDNTTRFVDALAAASNSSNTNVSMLGESFKYVAPVAGSLGYSIEDTAIALGLMANQGIKASQSGTALRTLLTNMANPTDTMASAMDALGVSLENGDGSMKSLMEVLQDLRKGFGQGNMDADEFTKSMTELQNSFDEGKISEDAYAASVENLMIAMYGAEGAQKAQLAAQLAGKSGMAGLLAIVNTGEEDFNNLADSIYNAAGTSQEMADIMNDNLSGQITIMLSALQELALQFGGILLPYIKYFVSWLQEMISKFQALSTEQKEQIVKWAAIVAAIGPVLLVFGKLTVGVGNVLIMLGKVPDAIKKIKSGFGLLKSAIAGVNVPMVAIVAAITTLVLAFKHLWETNEEFRARITEIWDGLKSKFESFGQGIVDRLNALGFDFANITEVMKAVWSGFCDMLAPVFEAAFSMVSKVLGGALDILTGILDVFIGLFTGNWEQLWQGVKEIFVGIWGIIAGVFTESVNAIKGVVEVVLAWFNTSAEDIKNSISNVITSIVEFFAQLPANVATFVTDAYNKVVQWGLDMVASAKETGRSFLDSVVEFFAELPYNIGYFIGAALAKVYVWSTDMVNKARETATNFLNNVITFFMQLPGNVLKFLTSTYDNANKWSADMANKAKEAATKFLANVVDTMVSLPGRVKQYLDSTINNLKTWVTEMGRKGKEAISELLNNVVEAAKDIPSKVRSIGTDIVNGVWQGILAAKNKFVADVKSFFDGIVDGVKDTLGIESPSKVFAKEVGRWLPAGVAVGFESAMSKATRDMQDSLDGSISSLKADNINVGIEDNLVNSMSAVAEYYGAIENRLADSVANMRSNLEYLIEAGTAAANGISLGNVGRSTNGKGNGDGNPDVGDVKNNGGGNTYVFYTTKAIDEIEAARQMQRTERDMAEGFV